MARRPAVIERPIVVEPLLTLNEIAQRCSVRRGGKPVSPRFVRRWMKRGAAVPGTRPVRYIRLRATVTPGGLGAYPRDVEDFLDRLTRAWEDASGIDQHAPATCDMTSRPRAATPVGGRFRRIDKDLVGRPLDVALSALGGANPKHAALDKGEDRPRPSLQSRRTRPAGRDRLLPDFRHA